MAINEQIATCSRQYARWKQMALESDSMTELKACLKKAMFWMELQTAFVTLWSVEQIRGEEPEIKRRLILAKSNLSKKLADYAQDVLDEINKN